MERRWYLGLTAGTIRPTLAAYAADLNLTHAQAIEQVARVNRAIATAEDERDALRAKLDAVPQYVRYLGRWHAGDGEVLDFGEWYAATQNPDPDTSADGLVIPDDGGDE